MYKSKGKKLEMGLSSNQARFLSITARKCDLEHRMQQICNRRLRLSNDLQGAARSYDNQTSDRKLFLKKINTDSLSTQDVSGDYESISATNLKKNGYQILDTTDNNVFGTFATGNTFKVSNAAELTAAMAAKPDATIVLQGNLDLTGGAFSTMSSAFTGKLYANGNTITTDKAIFDNISATAAVYDLNLAVSGGLSAGTKGFLANTNAGNIDNVNVTGTSINANGQSNAGVLVGVNNGSMTNIGSSVALTNGGTNVGGIAGVNNGGITDVITSQNASVGGTTNVGGITGYNNGSIEQATALGNISGTSDLGAVAGSNAGTISSVLAAGTIGTAGSTNVGGIVGANTASGSISDSYAIANIAGASNIGGLAGSNAGAIGITNVFIASESGSATSAVGSGSSGAKTIAALTSDNIDSVLEPTLSSDWSKSATTNAMPVLSGTPVTITTSTTNVTETKPITKVAPTSLASTGVTGLEATEQQPMYNKLSTLLASMKTTDPSITATDLQIVKYQTAVPDVASPGSYIYKEVVSLAVGTEKGLKAMDAACNSADATTKAQALSSNYVLTSNIVLTGADNWNAIGGQSDTGLPYTGGPPSSYATFTNTFTGMFDGNLCSVDNLNIQETGDARYQGMFGNIGTGGSVLRTTLTNAVINITGNAAGSTTDPVDSAIGSGVGGAGYVGTFAGNNDGIVENCNAENLNITIGEKAVQIGGLVGSSGRVNHDAIVNKCSTSGTITAGGPTGVAQIGGLSGWLLGGSTTFSSSSVDINVPVGSSYVAPLLGDLDTAGSKDVKYCYADGKINGANDTTLARGVNNPVFSYCYYGDPLNSPVIYDSSKSTSPDAGATWPSISGATIPVNKNGVIVNEPVWTSSGKLNNDASNTYNVSYVRTNADTATVAMFSASNQQNYVPLPTDLYSAGTTKADPTDAELEAGLRSGKYQLLVQSDAMTQSPTTTGNTGKLTFEKVDWRTEPIISDELDDSNDKAAQDTYDRVVRDVNEQDKLLQLEQEKVTTEYQALTSEKDAVKKILDTNAQGSFKYFS